MSNIIIIGGGWYGCHIALFLKSNGYNVTIIEKNSEIFDNSSFYNQNRLHLGYHYPRDYNTRRLCKDNFDKFVEKYNCVIDNIDKNYYLIANSSSIDYKTYKNIYTNENSSFEIIENKLFENINSNIFKVNEQVINSDKIKKYFSETLANQNINIILNTEVLSVNNIDNIIHINCNNNNFECEMLLDCTYNQLGLSSKKYIYELTISLVFKKIKNIDFGAITIMDGNFLSLYPRDVEKQLFTLTDVEYTPVIKSENYNDIKNYVITNQEIEYIKGKMIDKCKYYYPEFENDFEYVSYFISKKTKNISATYSRDINIEEINNNIVSVNCGKICGIFEFEKYIKELLIKNGRFK
jgi:hypothetical protein